MTSPETSGTTVTADELLDQMKKLLPAQFEEVILAVAPTGFPYVAAETAPLVERAIPLILLMAQQEDGLARLDAAVRKVMAHPSTPPARTPPPASPPLSAVSTPPPEPPSPSDEPSAPATARMPQVGDVSESVRRAEARVREVLASHPGVVSLLALQGLGDTAEQVTQTLFWKSSAHEVAKALNNALVPVGTQPLSVADRDAMRRLFNECLRYAIHWRELLTRARDAMQKGLTAFELPTRKESVAELILAGVHDQHPAFDLTKPSAAVGVTRVKLPPVLARGVAVTEPELTEAIVKHIAGTVFADNPDLDHARAHPASVQAASDVEGTLRALGYEGAGLVDRPYYILLDDGQPELWKLACDVQRNALPSLQLVRWAGPSDATDAALVAHIKSFLQRSRGA